MRKDSLIIFVTAIVLTLGIVGGLHYLYLQNQKTIPEQPAVKSKPKGIVNSPQPRSQTSKPTRGRTGKIIKCTHANGTIFWTNASRCEDADLNNTLSIYDHAKLEPRKKKDISSKKSSQQVNKSVKTIPRSMTNACSFPIGKARRIEKKSLRLKQDPSDSVWKDSYCRWVHDARKSGCKGVGDYLEYERLCF